MPDPVAKITISLPRDLLAKADAARGEEPRSTWIARTLAAALTDGGAGDPRPALTSGVHETKSAPRRAPAKRAGLTGVEAAQRALAARRVKSSAEAKAGVKPIQRASKPKPGRS